MPKKQAKKKLILLDAHAIIHRAYHALPDFTSPKGEPTGALYGLSSMLLRIISDFEPDYIAACNDLPGPTVRHEAYEAYKGTRKKLEDSLTHQLTTSRRVFEAFGIPIYERAGYEADDILGTIVELQAKDKNTDVIIASGDMDALQLVDDNKVKVYTLRKGLNDTVLYDADAVEARYGFRPELIPDYKGLRGDPSDNIKGVPGIGEKTATELIKGFGTIEQMYTTLKKSDKKFLDSGVKPRIIALLKEHEEDARFSKSLATIRRDAPIAFRLKDTKHTYEGALPALRALFDELGFRTLKPRAEAILGNGEDEELAEETEETPTPVQDIPPQRLREAGVMLWLLHSDFTNPSLDDILAYAGAREFDAAYDYLEKEIAKTGRVADVWRDIEKPLVPVLMQMQERGVMIDRKALQTLDKNYRKELDTVAKRIYTAAGKEFNISSPKQLGEILFDDLGLLAKGQKKTATGQRSTRESELEKIRDLHPIIDDILEYREIQKLLGTYIEAMPPLMDEHDRIHPEFIQTGAVTGRMATTNPSVQNIPIRTERGRKIRDAFIAPEGFAMVALDYSQIELRLAAILSGDEKLCDIFRAGRDIHTEVASMVFGVSSDKVDAEMRRRAKVINFGILYGMGVNSLKASLGTTLGEAHKFYDDYFSTFTTLAKYLESTKGYARKHGYTETLFGRRRQFPEMKSPLPYVRAQAERMAINAPLQGTQADIIKLAMTRAEQMLKDEHAQDDAHLLLQVHDELVYEVREGRVAELAKKICAVMEEVLPPEKTNGVPVLAAVRTGPNWGQMQKL